MNTALWMLLRTLLLILGWEALHSYEIPALAGDLQKCQGVAHARIDASERNANSWAWDELCSSGVIDFTDISKTCHDARNSGGTNNRQLSSKFIESIVSDPALISHLPPKGIKITGAIFPEAIDLSSLTLPVSISIETSRFEGSIDFSNVKSTHVIAITNSYVLDNIFADQMEVAALELQGSSVNSTHLSGSKIKGWLRMEGFESRNKLYAPLMQVDGDVMLNDGGLFTNKTTLKYSKVNGNLTLSNSSFNILDLSGVRIDGELQLGFTQERATRWQNNGKLLLRAAKVAGLRGWYEPWPAMNLDGFVYSWIQINNQEPIASQWYTDWLAKSDFSMQPYRKLSDVLRDQGLKNDADEVLFAGLERQRLRFEGSRYWLMTFQRYLIGYGVGLGYFNAVLIAAVLVILGRIILFLSGENDHHEEKIGIIYALATLFPVISLDKFYIDLRLKTKLAKRYFYLHKVCGYVLTAFVVAGVAGLSGK